MKSHITLFCILFVTVGWSQKSMDKLLKKYNKESIPYISVQELAMPATDAILLDSREVREYETSHIENAINVGYDHFDIDKVTEELPDKSAKIVVYCSVGIRSETIGEKLKKAGYTNVYNLYGGIFEWKNDDFKVYNDDGETDNVHTFNKVWSKYLLKGVKVY